MSDALLFNFVEPASLGKPVARVAKAQGGNWRQRLAANKSARREARKEVAAPLAPAPPQPVKQPEPDRPLKRKRDEPKAEPKRKTYISSLFSSNPSHQVVASPEQTVGQPSNAPSDGSFASLGLSTALSDVLQGPKLGLERPTPIQLAALPPLLKPDAGRDAILQAQTGSGKTIAYLLPILQDLLELAKDLRTMPDRSIGTLAIILVPTRELANQVYEVVTSLLAFKADGSQKWLTPGLLSGGMSRQHEKARLRKGIPLLIATPGRLLDHMQTTTSFRLASEPMRPPKEAKQRKTDQEIEAEEFEVEDKPFVRPDHVETSSSEDEFDPSHSHSYRPRTSLPASLDSRLGLRWLVLDEADRLMDMGFEPQIKEILELLTRRRRGNRLPRRTVLCSATMEERVEKLAGFVLRRPITFHGAPLEDEQTQHAHAPPTQLTQSYVVAPAKLRFVSLVALLRQVAVGQEPVKVLVFMSCTAAVDFYWAALGGLKMGRTEESSAPADDALAGQSQVLPDVPLYRLHGSLDLPTRLASLKAFTLATGPAILLCTSVAARGLDVPFVRCVVQYDLPTEGGATEYIHRVGRTARAGRGGSAWSFLLPSESEWVPWIRAKVPAVALRQVGVNDLLRDGFGGAIEQEYQDRATDVHMSLERWVEVSQAHVALARAAFTAHVRAYATHPSDEKAFFHIKSLHLGHLAKSFGLREAPSGLGGPSKHAPPKLKPTRAPVKAKRANDVSEFNVG